MLKQKKFILIFTVLAVFFGTVTVYGAAPAQPDLRVIINNNIYKVENPAPADMIPVRQVFEALGANVIWNYYANEVLIWHDQKVYRPATAIQDGKAMVPVSFINEIFGFNPIYYPEFNTYVMSDNTQKYTKDRVASMLSAGLAYSQDDLQWLSKIVHAEAKGEDYASKLAVANVILNRVNSGTYPNTIKDVIFDNKHGVQFTPTINGAINNTPSIESTLAALEALEGKNNAGDALFFINPRMAKSSWVSNNRSFAFASGNHNFYN